MAPAFKFGLGGRLGTGRQWMPWIHLDDAVSVVEHALGRAELSGAVLATSPTPVRQAEFADLLAANYGRKARARLPAWLLKLLLGPMADELLLNSQRCKPKRLEATEFVWACPGLEAAFTDLL